MSERLETSDPPPPGRAGRVLLVALFAAGLPLGLALAFLGWRADLPLLGWTGAGLASFSPMIAARLFSRFFKAAEMRPAMRRYNNRLMVNMIVYFAVLAAAIGLYDRGFTEGPLGYAVAVAPALPILGIFAIIGRFLKEETDEVMRDIVLTSLVWSGALTICEASVWGFLETFGKAPHVWLWVVPVAFFAQLGVTGPLAARRYR